MAFFILVAFGSFGMLVFGSVMEDFSGFIYAMEALLLLILGGGDYSAFVEAHTVLGPLFYCVFIYVVIFYVVNMFMTIVMKAYEQVSRRLKANSFTGEMFIEAAEASAL